MLQHQGGSLLLLIGESGIRPFLSSTPSSYSPPLALYLEEFSDIYFRQAKLLGYAQQLHDGQHDGDVLRRGRTPLELGARGSGGGERATALEGG